MQAYEICGKDIKVFLLGEEYNLGVENSLNKDDLNTNEMNKKYLFNKRNHKKYCEWVLIKDIGISYKLFTLFNKRISNYKNRILNLYGEYVNEITEKDLYIIIKYQKFKCNYCKKLLSENFSIDHITPISRGGLNTKNNIQICCTRCNSIKGALTI